MTCEGSATRRGSLSACGVLVCGAAMIALFAGCTSTQNARAFVGPADGDFGSVRLAALEGDANARSETPADRVDPPSLAAGGAGLDRSAWPLLTLDVPYDTTGGTSRYTRDYRYTETTARQRGEYPTPLSALELDGDTIEAQRDEAIVNPLMHLTQAALLLPRMIMRAPWVEVSHEPQPYWRAPATQSGGR